jgi:hypothetical protein
MTDTNAVPIVFRFEQANPARPLIFLGHTFDNALVTIELQPRTQPDGADPIIATVNLAAYVGATLVYEENFPDPYSHTLIEALVKSTKGSGFAEIIAFHRQRPGRTV